MAQQPNRVVVGRIEGEPRRRHRDRRHPLRQQGGLTVPSRCHQGDDTGVRNGANPLQQMPALQQPFVEGGRSQIEISYLGGFRVGRR